MVSISTKTALSTGPSPYAFAGPAELATVNFREFYLRDCMKKGRRVVVRYSSRYEKTLPNGPFRCRMELHRTSHACSKGTWTTEDP